MVKIHCIVVPVNSVMMHSVCDGVTNFRSLSDAIGGIVVVVIAITLALQLQRGGILLLLHLSRLLYILIVDINITFILPLHVIVVLLIYY